MRRLFSLVIAAVVCASTVDAQAVRNLTGFRSSALGPVDDESSGFVSLGTTVKLFGTNYSGLYVNNNGNVTFDDALYSYISTSLLSTGAVILAPYFSDVDTRGLDDLGTGSGLVTYGTDLIGGRHAFGVNWFSDCGDHDGGTGCSDLLGVGYYLGNIDPLNIFQLVLIDRSDIAPGDFDFEFNYSQVLWESGDASGGTGGLGGHCARAGYSDGSFTSHELSGSATCGAFIDGSATGLIHHRRDSDVNGRYVFSVRGGEVGGPGAVVPEPSSLLLIGSGLAAVGISALRNRLSRRPRREYMEHASAGNQHHAGE